MQWNYCIFNISIISMKEKKLLCAILNRKLLRLILEPECSASTPLKLYYISADCCNFMQYLLFILHFNMCVSLEKMVYKISPLPLSSWSYTMLISAGSWQNGQHLLSGWSCCHPPIWHSLIESGAGWKIVSQTDAGTVRVLWQLLAPAVRILYYSHSRRFAHPHSIALYSMDGGIFSLQAEPKNLTVYSQL